MDMSDAKKNDGAVETGVPASWLNIATDVRVVEEADELSVEVEGGWIRGTAPTGGLTVKGRSGYDIYVPQALLASEEIAALMQTVTVSKCVVRGCVSKPDSVGGLCASCWAFVCGDEGGESSQAYRNAVLAAKRRKTSR
jgi:hypothetical protein